jgi:hypothetical protein
MVTRRDANAERGQEQGQVRSARRCLLGNDDNDEPIPMPIGVSPARFAVARETRQVSRLQEAEEKATCPECRPSLTERPRWSGAEEADRGRTRWTPPVTEGTEGKEQRPHPQEDQRQGVHRHDRPGDSNT